MPAEQINKQYFAELVPRWFHNHEELLFNAMPVYSTGQTCAPQKEVE